jgi:lipopolysaccharide export system protein LptA
MTPIAWINSWKIALFIGAFFLIQGVQAQGNLLELLPGSEKIIVDREKGLIRLIGNVNFRYQGNTMYCDSAHYKEALKSVRAYGHVHILKDDVNLYCDSLYYNGNDKFAKLWGKVNVRDREYKITTDSLDYDAKLGKAIYRNKGKIESIVSNERITSKNGYFFPKTGTCFFSGNVDYKKDDLSMTTDTLQFVYEKQIVYFYGPTRIDNDSVTIVCKKGWYHLKKKEANLFRGAEIIQKNSLIKGDTLYYNDLTKSYEGRGNVYFKDYEQKLLFTGNKVRSFQGEPYTYLTGNALVSKIEKNDTLFIHADSILIYRDSIQKLDKIRAHDFVRLFNRKVQGICDSALYLPGDSLLRMKSRPILWTENAELKGVEMIVHFKDSTIFKTHILGDASAVMELDSGKVYNQIAGKEMWAFFKENSLKKVDVNGNAWTILYPEEEEKTDSTNIVKRLGMNRLFASDLRIYLDSGEVKGITYFDKPDGIFFPLNQIPNDELFIRGFSWNNLIRPKDPISMMQREKVKTK